MKFIKKNGFMMKQPLENDCSIMVIQKGIWNLPQKKKVSEKSIFTRGIYHTLL